MTVDEYMNSNVVTEDVDWVLKYVPSKDVEFLKPLIRAMIRAAYTEGVVQGANEAFETMK